MKASEVLVKARNLISRPECWIKGSDSRDTNGNPTWVSGTEPCSWCSNGALLHACDRKDPDYRSAYAILGKVCGDDFVSRWNDKIDRTHEQVLAVFDTAIEIAVEQERREASS